MGSTLKSAVFSLSLSLKPLVGRGGGLVCESVGKADLFSHQFDGKRPGSQLFCRSRAIRIRGLPPLPSGRVKSGVSC